MSATLKLVDAKGEVTCISAQLIPVTAALAKRFTSQQKLQILKEWELAGNGVAVAEKHQIHPMTLCRWKRENIAPNCGGPGKLSELILVLPCGNLYFGGRKNRGGTMRPNSTNISSR